MRQFIGSDPNTTVVGCFVEKEYGKSFLYANTQDWWALKHGLHLEMTSESGNKRYLRLLKTVAYIAVDENPDGSPVLEKWHIKRVRHVETSNA